MIDVNIYLEKQSEISKKEVQIRKKAVLNLCEKYFKTNRCLCADNFFSSISLCEELWANGIKYVGTIRASSESFLKSSSRPVESSLFAFKNELTLASYVPKKNKAVILVSTMRHNSNIDNESKKQQMILDYSKLKGLKNSFFYALNIYSLLNIIL